MIGFSFEKESYCLEVKISPSIRNVQGNTVLHKSMCNSTWLLRGDDRVQLRDGKLIGDKDKPKHKQRPGEHCIVAIKKALILDLGLLIFPFGVEDTRAGTYEKRCSMMLPDAL